MARFNIETKIFREQGFQDLLITVGNRHTAKGIVWELFETAQEYWFPNKNFIPIEVFRAKGLPEVLFAPNGLAELRDEGVYVRGSKAAFQWLFEKAEAGRKSGVSRRAKKSEEAPKPLKRKRKEQNEQLFDSVQQNEHVFSSVEQTRTNANEREQTRTSLLSSLSSSLSSPSSNSCSDLFSVTASVEAEPAEVIDDGKKTKLFIAKYHDEWLARHGSKPQLVGKDFGIAKRLAKYMSPTEITKNLEAYFEMPDPWLEKAKHPLELFESKLKEISAFAESGRFTTRKQVIQNESAIGTATLLGKIRSGGV